MEAKKTLSPFVAKSMNALHKFQKEFPEKVLKVSNCDWRVIDTADFINYKEGTPTLLLLPGTQGTPSIFWNQISTLSKDIRFVSLGYPSIPNATSLAENLLVLLEQEKINKPYILGSSLGGYIAQMVAIKQPSKVSGLFLANAMVDARPLVAKRTPTAQLKKLTEKELRVNILKRIESFPEVDEGFTVMKEVLKETITEKMSGEEIKSRFMSLDECGALEKINLPESSIFIIDSNDDFVMPQESRLQLRALYPHAETHTFETGGHFPYITRPEEYTKVINQHVLLKQVPLTDNSNTRNTFTL